MASFTYSASHVEERIRIQINARFGLVAAQRMLRHAQVGVTAAHYVEIKTRPVLGFGHLLTKDTRTIVPIDEAQAS